MATQHNNQICYHTRWSFKAPREFQNKIVFFMPKTYLTAFRRDDLFTLMNAACTDLFTIVGNYAQTREERISSEWHDRRTGMIYQNFFVRELHGEQDLWRCTITMVRSLHETNLEYMKRKGLLEAEAAFKPIGG